MAYKTIQLLRNVGTTYANHDAAVTGLTEQLASCLDGQPILARYNDGSKERTILAIKSQSGYEFFDNAAGNDAITAAINALKNGASEDFDTLKEIEDVIKAMDLAQVGGTAGDVITAVSEADGKVSASTSPLSDITLTGYSKTNDTGDIAAIDTVEVALSKLENKSAATTVKSTDKTVNITDNNGKDLSVNIDSKTIVKNSTTGVLSSGLSIAKEIDGLASNVREQYKLVDADGNAISGAEVIKIYKDSALVNILIGHVDDRLTNADGEGESPDTAITNGTGDAALVYIMQLADGNYKLAAVNVESFLEESEFADGLQVNSHVVSVKKDTTSGKVRIADAPQSGEDTGLVDVLTVSSEGVKVDNIQDAINYAVSTATDALDFTDTVESHKFVTKVNETDGVISVTREQPTAGDIATTAINADATHVAIAGTDAATQIENISIAIKAEETARANAIAGLDYTDTVVANQFVTEVNEVDGVISVQRAQPAAAGVTVADSGEYFASANVEGALAELAAFDCGTY